MGLETTRPSEILRADTAQPTVGKAAGGLTHVFAGFGQETIIAVEAKSLNVSWQTSAGGVEPDFVCEEVGILVADHPRIRDYRGIDVVTGQPRWNVTAARWGALRWGTNLLVRLEDLGWATLRLDDGAVLETLPWLPTAATPRAVVGETLVYGMREHAGVLGASGLRDGLRLWERDILAELSRQYDVEPERPFLSVVGDGSDVLVGRTTEGLFGFALASGDLLWHHPISVPYYRPDTREGRVYIWSRDGSYQSHFVCIDQREGAVIYDRLLASDHRFLEGLHEPAPGTFADDQLAFATRKGLLASFSTTDGALRLIYRHRASLYPPVFSAGRLFAPSSDGSLLVFEGFR